MPITKNMPYSWYDTPNIHFCTIRDFRGLCGEVGAQMERAVALDSGGTPVRMTLPWWAWNLLGEQGVFLLRRERE
jgi:methionine biosynthesis protein MetW